LKIKNEIFDLKKKDELSVDIGFISIKNHILSVIISKFSIVLKILKMKSVSGELSFLNGKNHLLSSLISHKIVFLGLYFQTQRVSSIA